AVAYSVALTEIAAACASTAVGMAVTNMVAEMIVRNGSPEQQRRFVPKLVSGEAVAGAFSMSEPHSGSDAAALRTKAVRKGDRWVINGTKQWVTSGEHAGVIVLVARTDGPGTHGVSCFVVEGGTPGLVPGRPEDKMGLRASNTVPLVLDNCEVPAENLLGKEGDGFKIALRALDGGRIGIASQAVGVARAALDASVRYAKDRHAFGAPIADFQAIRWYLADVGTELDAASLLTLRAASRKEKGLPFTKDAAMAKLFATEMVQRACDKAVQIHGGYGYIDEFPVERYLRDARVQTLYEGSSEIQRFVIAREIIKSAGS
ncbi:MAG TPA: acyl-CoA dehydrogenase family protein, partial [Myxococcaceae bacterium]|nr:acyl-CoA dehydrogenase family protein [Myxococcaceae bacterium]